MSQSLTVKKSLVATMLGLLEKNFAEERELIIPEKAFFFWCFPISKVKEDSL